MTVGILARTAVFVALCGAFASGCSSAPKVDLKGTAGTKISRAADVPVPPTVLGLAVGPEDVSKTIANSQRAYIDSLALYGLRSDNLLQATLQISRFNADAKYQTDKFRLEVVNQVGTQRPIALVVDTQPVYLTAGNKQRIYVWFRGRYFFVMATRQDYPTPRALLRQLLLVRA